MKTKTKSTKGISTIDSKSRKISDQSNNNNKSTYINYHSHVNSVFNKKHTNNVGNLPQVKNQNEVVKKYLIKSLHFIEQYCARNQQKSQEGGNHFNNQRNKSQKQQLPKINVSNHNENAYKNLSITTISKHLYETLKDHFKNINKEQEEMNLTEKSHHVNINQDYSSILIAQNQSKNYIIPTHSYQEEDASHFWVGGKEEANHSSINNNSNNNKNMNVMSLKDITNPSMNSNAQDELTLKEKHFNNNKNVAYNSNQSQLKRRSNSALDQYFKQKFGSPARDEESVEKKLRVLKALKKSQEIVNQNSQLYSKNGHSSSLLSNIENIIPNAYHNNNKNSISQEHKTNFQNHGSNNIATSNRNNMHCFHNSMLQSMNEVNDKNIVIEKIKSKKQK